MEFKPWGNRIVAYVTLQRSLNALTNFAFVLVVSRNIRVHTFFSGSKRKKNDSTNYMCCLYFVNKKGLDVSNKLHRTHLCFIIYKICSQIEQSKLSTFFLFTEQSLMHGNCATINTY